MYKISSLFIALAFYAATPIAALASVYPNKSINMMIGFAAGGPTDVLARSFAQQLSAELGVPIVVENKPGADSLLASQAVMNAKPDGYTIYFATSAHAINPSMFSAAKFRVRDDFTPISMIGEVPTVIATGPNIPVKTLGEFFEYAKARDGQLNYATTASNTYLETAFLLRTAGVNLQRISYKGGSPATVALMAGEVHLMLSGIGPLVPLVQSGKIRGLAITGSKRSNLLPELPTVAEAGFPNFSGGVWYALLAPPGVPADIVKRLNNATRSVLREPTLMEKAAGLGVDLRPTSSQELGDILTSEEKKWSKIVVDLNARQ